MDPQHPQLPPADDTSLPAGDDVLELPADDTPTLPSGDSEKREKDEVPAFSISIEPGVGDTLTATQAIIGRQAARLDELKADLKRINDSLRSILDNDQELAQAEEQAKEYTKKQKERKQQLSQNAESMQLKYKLKELREQMKEIEESLNNHLINFFQMTGAKVFDTDVGEQREFKITARVLAKKIKPE
jgi:hypothetical protein